MKFTALFINHFEAEIKMKSNFKEKLKENINLYTVKQFIYNAGFVQCITFFMHIPRE